MRVMTNVTKLLVQDWMRSGGGAGTPNNRLTNREDDAGTSMIVSTCLTLLNVALEQVAWLEPDASPRLLVLSAGGCDFQWEHPQKQMVKQLWMVAAAGALLLLLLLLLFAVVVWCCCCCLA
jgi:uncharacterized integral membrane protein